MQRRQFIQQSLGLAGLSAVIAGCHQQQRPIPGSIIGASSQVGHLLREHHSFPVSGKRHIPTLIIGGGVSGLSAARWLSSNYNYQDYLLIDLETEVGGNARHGKNTISAYPWGAHYVPIANNNCKEYLSFLHEAAVIEKFDNNGLPAYKEEMLCSDPQDRLYINGLWQDGLIPLYGVDENGKREIKRFMDQMDHFRNAIGEDGKEAFAIPVASSSKDPKYSALDQINMAQWMKKNNYHHPALQWYINYCTRDDFGTTYNEASAWAGIHYFAGRKGKASNAHYSDVLTWPEGNGFLVNKLNQSIKGEVQTGKLAMNLQEVDGKWRAKVLDINSKTLEEITADNVILATPQFVNIRMLNNESYTQHAKQHFSYSPWMVANLTVRNLEERSGQPASWDNVLYESQSLGYVDATHQMVEQIKTRRNLTYYLPLTHLTPAEARREAMEKSHAAWCKQIIDDLKIVHENIESSIENIDIMLWGHAMIQPRVGLIHGDAFDATRQLAKGIQLAHTDMSGISIFEEAFYQGIEAANAIMNKA